MGNKAAIINETKKENVTSFAEFLLDVGLNE
jgi:hypothetical protein